MDPDQILPRYIRYYVSIHDECCISKIPLRRWVSPLVLVVLENFRPTETADLAVKVRSARSSVEGGPFLKPACLFAIFPNGCFIKIKNQNLIDVFLFQ